MADPVKHHRRPRYLTRDDVVDMVRRERHKYASTRDMADAWGIKTNSMDRILREGRIEGHAARQLGLRPITLYTRD
jgi:hypothetical protein